jgi:hypothetical protein
MFLQSEHDIGSFLLREQDAVTWNFSLQILAAVTQWQSFEIIAYEASNISKTGWSDTQAKLIICQGAVKSAGTTIT